MLRLKRQILLITVLSCMSSTPNALAQGFLSSDDVRVTLEKEAITALEPVIMDITIQAPPSIALDYDPGYDWENVEVSAFDPHGVPQKRPPRAIAEGMRFSNAVHLAAGGTETLSVALSDWFSFEELGTYEIEVVLRRSVATPITTKLLLQVGPRNEDALRTTCSDLSNRIFSSPSFSQSLVAAKALSDVNDPTAIPFLVAGLKKRQFTSLMVAALAKLNTPDALGPLREASNSPDRETSELARSALTTVQRRPYEVRRSRPLGKPPATAR